MNYLIKAVILLSTFVATASWAQQEPSAFAYSEIILEEQAIESPKVVIVYSEASGVVEIRFQECDECEYRTSPPAEDLTLSAGEERLSVDVVAEQYNNSPGTVFFDISTSKVNRVQYFETRNGGDNK